jgi:hypothetical protein
MQIEIILEKERMKKSAAGTKGSNFNGTKPVLMSQITEEQDNIDVIRKNEIKGQNYNPNHQGNKNNGNRPSRCLHCHKPGNQVQKCFTKFPTNIKEQ